MFRHSEFSKLHHRAQNCFNKTAVAIGVALALGAGANVAHAAKSAVLCTPFNSSNPSIGNNFTMLQGKGQMEGGTNDVTFTWDGTMFDASSDYTGPGLPANMINATISSPALFSGYTWTAHDVQVFKPGSYTFNTTLGNATPGSAQETETGKKMTVGPNQLGFHMLFDWNSNLNIDVLMVVNKSVPFGSGKVTPVKVGGSVFVDVKGDRQNV